MHDTTLDHLAAQCLRVRDLIDALGDPTMRAAIDLLLIEIARALAASCPPERGQEA
jgi:hypothetical protein